MPTYLITGAAGLVGPALAARLLEDPANKVILTDLRKPAVPAGAAHPQNAQLVEADLTKQEAVDSLVATATRDEPLAAAFVFHGIMSGASEADPALAQRVNVDAVRSLLFKLADVQRGVRVVFASSNAVYGLPLPDIVTEATTPTPNGVYGACKYQMEILVNDMNRRGLIDAFSVRFPTIVVRPGAPSPAASAFLSGVIREPMNGAVCTLPLRDRQFKATLCSPRVCIENLLRVVAWPSDKLPPHQRAVNFPGIVSSVQDLLDALAKVGGADKLQYVVDEPNAAYEAILRSWAWNLDYSKPIELGLLQDVDTEGLVREYVATLK